MENFEKLGLSQEILKVIKNENFEKPSEIQEKTIPLALAGNDIIGCSSTGSGKTLAFASPIIQNMKPSGSVQALILCPTRELASQVAKSIQKFSKYYDLKTEAIYGGVGIEPQFRKIANADIIVGTPGRVQDHIDKKTLRLNSIKYLVLDEVDRMFDMGFYDSVERIISECPKNRQTMLFSATISKDIEHLTKKHTNNPKTVSVSNYVDHSQLKQIYYDVDHSLKFSLLVHLLKNEESGLVMVFCNTRRGVDFLERNLNRTGIEAVAIHGGLSQNQRTKVLNSFHGNSVTVLICTDVAARGLDIQNVTHVYNYDLPKASEDYVHRIGRTARAKNKGKAINLLSGKDYESFEKIIRNENLKIDLEELPSFEKSQFSKTGGEGRERNSGGYSRDNRNRGNRSYSGQGNRRDSGRSSSGGRRQSSSGRRQSSDNRRSSSGDSSRSRYSSKGSSGGSLGGNSFNSGGRRDSSRDRRGFSSGRGRNSSRDRVGIATPGRY
jgi:ATP-dependent RNA helicase DeaD